MYFRYTCTSVLIKLKVWIFALNAYLYSFLCLKHYLIDISIWTCKSFNERNTGTKNQCEFIWNRFIGVYAFGFLFMLPQLFVNYKVRDYPSIIKTYLHLISHWKWKCDEIFTTILYKILFFIFANLTIWFGILENYFASRSSFRRNFEGILHIWHASFIVIMFYLFNLCIIYCVICHYLICWGSLDTDTCVICFAIDTKERDIQTNIVYLIKKNIHMKDCTLKKNFESIRTS